MKNSSSANSIIYFILLVCIIVTAAVLHSYLKETINHYKFFITIPILFMIAAYGRFLVKKNVFIKKFWILLLIATLGGVFFIDTQLMDSFEWYRAPISSVAYILFFGYYGFLLWRKSGKQEI